MSQSPTSNPAGNPTIRPKVTPSFTRESFMRDLKKASKPVKTSSEPKK